MMRWILAELLLASLLIGLAHVAGLPPFEGFDETAHYSYIEQIAKTGRLPHAGDKLRQDAVDAVLQYRFFTADTEFIERVRQALKAPRDPPAAGEPASQ
jgi:hypothetical protein